jgi:copper resistance protein B
MKFLRRNYSSAVAGLISFVGLTSYAPLLRAEAELPLRVENNQAEIMQFTPRIAEDIHEAGLLPLVENNQAETIRSALKNQGSLNENELSPLAEDNRTHILRPTLETGNDINQEQGASPVEDNQGQTLQPTVEIANDTNQEQGSLLVEENRVQTFQPAAEIANETNREQWPSPVEDNQVFWLLLIDQLEYRNNNGSNTLNWNAQGWVGGDYRRIWVKTEGEVDLEGDEGTEAEIQVLYGQLIAPFWDFQVGLRYDRLDSADSASADLSVRDRSRAFAVVGVQGLTPYLFEVDAALFISEDGDVSARLSAEYDLLLTQRLILQPEFEINLAVQQVEDFGVGTGLNDIELGLRLRYEITRKFAPYVGISWTRKFGGAADFAREEGESTDNFSLVGGLRLLF